MKNYVIQVRDSWGEDLEGITDKKSFDQFAGKTYYGFERVTSGSFEGGYSGIANGTEVIFWPEELQTVKEEESSVVENRLREEIELLKAKLELSEIKVKQLEKKAVADSWEGEVDRQGGQFTDEEINRHTRDTW